MARFLMDDDKCHRVWSHNGGVGIEIERLSDGATVFMQGDDAVSFEADMEALTGPDGLPRRQLDDLCRDYSDIMS